MSQWKPKLSQKFLKIELQICSVGSHRVVLKLIEGTHQDHLESFSEYTHQVLILWVWGDTKKLYFKKLHVPIHFQVPTQSVNHP